MCHIPSLMPNIYHSEDQAFIFKKLKPYVFLSTYFNAQVSSRAVVRTAKTNKNAHNLVYVSVWKFHLVTSMRPYIRCSVVGKHPGIIDACTIEVGDLA